MCCKESVIPLATRPPRPFVYLDHAEAVPLLPFLGGTVEEVEEREEEEEEEDGDTHWTWKSRIPMV